ncbi:BlaI/MecI/CopY family transcriptional regulator [candidate division KSB1 bacterium]|nr:BlaI/MecI/CopY family transcriptional regulator [candidate division KSB1 bacterium]
MRKKESIPELTKAEYDIMRILWKHGEQSVREIYDALKDTQGWALTTVRTMMDRMANKGLLEKENYHGVFIFKPMISRPAGLARMVRFFADRVLETDTNTVVAMFSNTKGLSTDEIDELKKLLDEDE